MAGDCIGPEVDSLVNGLANGEACLLENVRFYSERDVLVADVKWCGVQEEKNEKSFSQKLASPFDMYVNDAFGTAH
eukprot:3871883-Rhodomonas_salina.2